MSGDIEIFQEEIERIAREDEACQRLRQIPGVRPLVSTATGAAIGNGAAFRKGTVNSQLGWDWCPASTRPAEGLSYSASVNAATLTYAACSSMAQGLYCCESTTTRGGLASGCISSKLERHATK